jgi:ATP-dependent Clp protease ATP-binding subunit ClpC
MFEKFTEGAVKVIMLAQEESRRMGHNYVGSEQLLLGLLGQKHGIAARALSEYGVTLKKLRNLLEKTIGRGSGFVGSEIPFTPRAKRILEMAIHQAKDLGVNYVGTEHILLAIVKEGEGMGAKMIRKLGIMQWHIKGLTHELIKLQQENIGDFTPEILNAMRDSKARYELNKLYSVEPEGLTEEQRTWWNRERDLAKSIIERTPKLPLPIPKNARYSKQEQGGAGSGAGAGSGSGVVRKLNLNNRNKGLKDFSENLTEKAKKQLLDPVIGRDEEINCLVKVLARRRKNNPVLVGEAGVGKTACAEGLAILIKNGNCPDFLNKHVIYNLDIGSILAGTKYRGEFEERFKYIIEEVQQHGKIILVIDEIHTIVGAGAAEGAVDAANLLKPALARGTLKIIGATTIDEYRKHIEKDPALERRFHPITVEEPSVETTIDILRGLRSYYQVHHSLIYEDDALTAAATLSNRFITDRNLPDKAIDVIDECGSEVRVRNRQLPPGLQRLLFELQKTTTEIQAAIKDQNFELVKLLMEHELEVRAHMKVVKAVLRNNPMHKERYDEQVINTFDRVLELDVANVISNWTGIPVTKLNESETERLKKMENILHNRLIGQHHAIIAVSKAVRRSRTGIQDPKRPIASFMFAGPTGVGKTELTKALCEYIFETEKNMIRFDMSEFMEKHTASKLIGSPPGYVGHDEGGQLTDAVKRQPYSIILFDEVEKAHPDIFNLFLQILDDGQLTDSKGKLSDFKNCIIVMTTNLGSQVIENQSTILSQKQKTGSFQKESWEFDEEEELTLRESKKVELIYNLDGTFTIKPPVRQEVTEEDKSRFQEITDLVKDELKKFFRPEFLNRIDDIIVFNHLSKHDIWEISGVMLKNLEKRLESQGVTIEIDDAVRFFLVQEGYDPIYGARPLRRAIINLLEDALASACLDSPLQRGTHIIVKQQLRPNPTTQTYFDDIYTNKILITFDNTNVKVTSEQ